MNGGEGDHGALRRSVGWTGGTAVPGWRGASACRGIHRQARYCSWHRGGAGPGSAVVLVPGSAFAEGPQNWLGACGKTQLAVSLAESLWQSGAINALIWIAATSRAAVLSAYAQAYMAGTGIGPAGTAESVAARFVSWLGTTSQPWLVVLDDLQDPADLDGLWPEGPEGRLLVTSRQSTLASGLPRMRVGAVEFFSVREALSCLTGRLSTNPVQRTGAVDLIKDLGREPLALAQAASVVANSTLTCRDYREYFARRRQQVGVAPGAAASAAMVTWTLSLGQAESLLPGESVRLMLVIVALLDGHGIPGAIFDTPTVSAYLGAAAAPFSPAADLKPAWAALLAIERAGMITVDRAETPPTILMSSVLAGAIRRAAPARSRTLRRGRQRVRCWKPGPPRNLSRGPRPGCARTWPACRTRPPMCCGPGNAIRCCCVPAGASTAPV